MTVRDALKEVALTLLPKISAGKEKADYNYDFPPHGDPEHLAWMVDQIAVNINTWPIDKSARWLGFIQAMMVAQSWITVDEERDRTRPIFHQAYIDEGLETPRSVGK